MSLPIDGGTRLFAIVGDPISAVRSPEVFNAWFARAGRNAVLVPMHVAAQDLPRVVAGLQAIRNLDGIVVTMPHKAAACALVDALGPMATVVGAINAMRREPDGRWCGEMFDGRGFVDGLRAQGIDMAGLRVRQVGAGAAGTAVAVALAEAGVASLRISDIAPERVRDVVSRVGQAYPEATIEIAATGDVGDCELVVNVTPLGMRPEDPLPFDPDAWPASVIVADVVTQPEMTPLLLRAQAGGHRVHTGRHMHEGQARLAAAFLGVSVA
ncbi:MAG: shikimate dehydrogenase [Burkholderiales bacterium]